MKPTLESKVSSGDGEYVRECERKRYGTERLLETRWMSFGLLISLTDNYSSFNRNDLCHRAAGLLVHLVAYSDIRSFLIRSFEP